MVTNAPFPLARLPRPESFSAMSLPPFAARLAAPLVILARLAACVAAIASPALANDNDNDPNPMMNMRGPETDPFRGWDADSCQFRLTTDPKVGYPILDESTFKYKGKGDLTETRDDIVHLTLWHYTETGEPQLAMQLGMTYREPKTPRAASCRRTSLRRSI
jgi:hypothetical protein